MCAKCTNNSNYLYFYSLDSHLYKRLCVDSMWIGLLLVLGTLDLFWYLQLNSSGTERRRPNFFLRNCIFRAPLCETLYQQGNWRRKCEYIKHKTPSLSASLHHSLKVGNNFSLQLSLADSKLELIPDWSQYTIIFIVGIESVFFLHGSSFLITEVTTVIPLAL